MADPVRSRGTAASGTGPPGAPRWVRVFVIIVIAAAVPAIAVAMFGGGSHGPGRHVGAGAPDSAAPTATTVPSGRSLPPSQVAVDLR